MRRSRRLTETTDPFVRHPELRDRIADPAEAVFFRTLSVETLFADKPDLHWVVELLHTDEVRETSRRRTLADHDGGDLWIFGYGSLMWNPAIHFAEVRRAALPGHARRFILKDIYGGRGTRDAPGLMAALDPGDGCEGLLFRIRAEDIEAETEILWRRECIGPGYLPAFVTAEAEGAPVRALTFLADHSADTIEAGLGFDEQVRLIARGTGFLGSSRDYLAGIVDHLRTLDIHDADCAALLDAVDREVAATRPAAPQPPKGPAR